MTVGDFNADGKTDLAVANSCSNNVGVLLGNGAGGFAAAVTYASGGSSPNSVTVGDFNADGKDDLAVANYAQRQRGRPVGQWRRRICRRRHLRLRRLRSLLRDRGRFQRRRKERPGRRQL